MNRMIPLARALRKKPTDAERRLWRRLRSGQVSGFEFRRQHPLGNYVVDFVCLQRMLVVEIDGGHHAVQRERDAARDAWIRSQGYRVLRFWNNEVMANVDGVLEVVGRALLNDSD